MNPETGAPAPAGHLNPETSCPTAAIHTSSNYSNCSNPTKEFTPISKLNPNPGNQLWHPTSPHKKIENVSALRNPQSAFPQRSSCAQETLMMSAPQLHNSLRTNNLQIQLANCFSNMTSRRFMEIRSAVC